MSAPTELVDLAALGPPQQEQAKAPAAGQASHRHPGFSVGSWALAGLALAGLGAALASVVLHFALAPAPPVAGVDAPGVAGPARDPVGLGTLKLDSDPPAQVSEAGRPIGTTPLRIELPAGSHRLLLEHRPLGLKREISVTVVEGRETPVSENLRSP